MLTIIKAFISLFLLCLWEKGTFCHSYSNFGQTLPEKCPYSELLWFGCGKMRARITPNKDTFYAVKQKRRGRPFLEGIRRGPHSAITLKTIWLS